MSCNSRAIAEAITINLDRIRLGTMKNAFNNPAVKEHFLEGGFGLEKEGLRVDQEGYLAHTPHPFGDDPHFDRDFCENQVELVTDVYDSVEGVWNGLAGLMKTLVKTLDELPEKELMWPFSNPPYIRGEEDVPIAQFQGEKREKTIYRNYLAEKYGRKIMTFSGIHFNYSLSDNLLHALHDQCCHGESFEDFKDHLYLRLAKKVVEYDWLIVYLMAASPVMDGSYFTPDRKGEEIGLTWSSPRCSEIGYWNSFIPILKYNNLHDYVDSIEEYVERGELRQAAELYYPVRLKPRGVNSLDNLKKTGVDHIELRMLDLNPLSPIGIIKEDIQFLHLMLLYLIFQDEERFGYFEQVMAIKNAKSAALCEESRIWIETRWRQSIPVRAAARDFLGRMERFYHLIMLDSIDIMDCIEAQWTKILRPEERYASKIYRQFGHNYVERGLHLAREYTEQLISGDIKEL